MIRKILLFSIIGLLVITSCTKDKPPTGNYKGTFTYDTHTPPGRIVTSPLEITETYKNSIIINGSTLEKDGKKIEGEILYVPNTTGLYIKGEWKHSLFNDDYRIDGTFTEYEYHGSFDTIWTGTFIIKADF